MFLRSLFVFLLSNFLSLNFSCATHDSFIELLSKVMPLEKIEVTEVKNTVILSGVLKNLESADRVEKLAVEFYGSSTKILNFMTIAGSQQVMLRVKIGEVKKNVMKFYQNTNTNFEYLNSKGLVKILSEPNLVAMSGERAEFLAGGEFPVPTLQKDGNISVNYKSYGVKVAFTPLVISGNRIRINVEQELSGIKNRNHVKLAGYSIPSVNSRRARTTIELAPGEGFMIAGLTQDEMGTKLSKETELVISVAAYLVDPINPVDIKFPVISSHKTTKLEKNFIETISKSKGLDGGKIVVGPVGFISE